MKEDVPARRNGVLISAEAGTAVAYALWKLQERGRMFVTPGEKIYEGMIIGIHSRENDLVVNPAKTKQLTNIRAAGKDDAILLTPPVELTLEAAVEFIDDDELVEVTPQSIRLRKRQLMLAISTPLAAKPVLNEATVAHARPAVALAAKVTVPGGTLALRVDTPDGPLDLLLTPATQILLSADRGTYFRVIAGAGKAAGGYFGA